MSERTPDGDGDCTICGIKFYDENGTEHECPPGFTRTPEPGSGRGGATGGGDRSALEGGGARERPTNRGISMTQQPLPRANDPDGVIFPAMDMDQLLTAAVHHIPAGLMAKWLNRVHEGDAVEVMSRMPAESVDLFVTSPPYNLRNSTGNGMKDGRGGKWKNAALLKGYDDHEDTMPHDKYVEWQRDCLTAMMRLLKPDGAIFYNHKWRVQAGLLQDRADIVSGFPVRQIIIWQRAGGINFNPGYFLPTYEVLYLICKPDFKLAPKANALGDIWRIPQEYNNTHPAPFPVELAQRCIGSTNAKIICDPFMGSGTTAIAAEALGRNWIGIEKSKDYWKLARERILAARQRSDRFQVLDDAGSVVARLDAAQQQEESKSE